MKKFSKWAPFIGGACGIAYAYQAANGYHIAGYAAVGALIARVFFEVIRWIDKNMDDTKIIENSESPDHELDDNLNLAENEFTEQDEVSDEEIELSQNSLPVEIDNIVIPDTIMKLLPQKEEALISCITEYKKYIEEEWTESVPMYAAIELDKSGVVFTPEINDLLNEYARNLKCKNFVGLVSLYIPG